VGRHLLPRPSPAGVSFLELYIAKDYLLHYEWPAEDSLSGVDNSVQYQDVRQQACGQISSEFNLEDINSYGNDVKFTCNLAYNFRSQFKVFSRL
jgi:hypothetical protein